LDDAAFGNVGGYLGALLLTRRQFSFSLGFDE